MSSRTLSCMPHSIVSFFSLYSVKLCAFFIKPHVVYVLSSQLDCEPRTKIVTIPDLMLFTVHSWFRKVLRIQHVKCFIRGNTGNCGRLTGILSVASDTTDQALVLFSPESSLIFLFLLISFAYSFFFAHPLNFDVFQHLSSELFPLHSLYTFPNRSPLLLQS